MDCRGKCSYISTHVLLIAIVVDILCLDFSSFTLSNIIYADIHPFGASFLSFSFFCKFSVIIILLIASYCCGQLCVMLCINGNIFPVVSLHKHPNSSNSRTQSIL